MKPRDLMTGNQLDDLQQQILALQAQRDLLIAQEKASVIEAINNQIKSFGITARELTFMNTSRSFNERAKAVIKFKKGNDVWAGRGRKPKWVEDHLANGGTLDDLRISP